MCVSELCLAFLLQPNTRVCKLVSSIVYSATRVGLKVKHRDMSARMSQVLSDIDTHSNSNTGFQHIVACSNSQHACWQVARSASRFSFLLVHAVVSLTRRLLSLSAASVSSLISPPLCSSFSLCNRCNQLAFLEGFSSFTVLSDRAGCKGEAPWQMEGLVARHSNMRHMLASCQKSSKALTCS